jgi:hypothetical protein
MRLWQYSHYIFNGGYAHTTLKKTRSLGYKYHIQYGSNTFLTKHNAMTAYWGSGGIASCIP